MSRFADFKINDEQIVDVAKATSSNKFLNPGLHSVKIKEVTDKGPFSTDPTWFMLRVVFEDATGRTINTIVPIPTVSVYYNEKTWAYKKFVKFCVAVGLEVDVKNLKALLIARFDKLEPFLGMDVEVQVGYEGWYPHFVAKDVYELRNPQGEPAKTEDDLVHQFTNRAEACMFGRVTISKKVTEFAEVLNYGTPQKNVFKEVVLAKKPKAVKVEEDASPFD